MAAKKLPSEVQSKFRASVQIRTFKTAVEELVYNALDANSSSIAIRVHVQENYIQVVDNGCGVASNDFAILGLRHATSKFENPSSSKSMQNYGCYGQSLANLVQVSQSVKIISKCMESAETWMKHFRNGQEEECSVILDRPSVGTTVEIKGFLYNLPIHKKAVNVLQELDNIKKFLEQMSLVHCNTSISLRNNSENEIIFKTHKNRDIIQTLSSVLNIDTSNLQELKVEKNQYKVTGFIKKNDEESMGYQWIFVNERFIGNSNLHKIVNENLAAGVALKNIVNAKSYKFEDENVSTNYKLPDYFLFINCPRNDYEIILNPKQSILEFKNLPHINKLLEKLVKFHRGDINLVNKANSKEQTITLANDKGHETGTRNKVKQIIHKILASQQRKMNGSNLHNGVKGKKIRRKAKTKVVSSSKTKLKVLREEDAKMIQEKKHVFEDPMIIQNQSRPSNNVVINNNTVTSIRVPRNKPTEDILANDNQEQNPLIHEKDQHVEEDINKNKNKNINKNQLLSNFEKETDEVQKRCNILAKKVDHLLGVNKKRKCKVFTNETVHYSRIVRDNKSISIRKKINEIIIHEYLPLSRKNIAKNSVNILNEIKTSNDLIQPVMNIVNQTNVFRIPSNAMYAKMVQPQSDPCSMHDAEAVNSKIPRSTFESHGYFQETQITQGKEALVERYKMRQFIGKISRDNFASPNKNRNIITDSTVVKKQNVPKSLYHHNIENGVFTDVDQSSYSIHFTKTDTRESELGENVLNATDDTPLSDILNIDNTYTVVQSDNSRSSYSSTPNRSCTFAKPGNLEANWNTTTNANSTNDESSHIQNTQKETEITDARLDNNVVFISNSHNSITGSNGIEPLEICETVISSLDKREFEEYTLIFDSINNVIEITNPITIRTRQTCETACGTQRYTNSYDRNSEEDGYLNANLRKNIENSRLCDNNVSNNFNLKNRRRFIPKGMSPLFENYNLKSVCDYKFNEDYFKDTVYDNFVQNVQIHSEVFEPKIQNVKDTATRDIQRADNKLTKDNACITFNGQSLKHAKVLRQVDNKFIATIIKSKSNSANDCFVLLDQHAVHERIRLEENMSEYVTHNQWKSVALDGVSLKLTKDEILYLHNHKDKFQRLGLQWSILGDTRVLVNAIPEAILGKHPRQVDVVLKAVKNLIKEEINIIKEQGGCVSLYPKSIMDLVFSEACRYAIMFGDSLSARECASLVSALSRCKTPFQCAHGRPSMAVLLEVARETRPYTVNFAGVEQFRRKLNKFNK